MDMLHIKLIDFKNHIQKELDSITLLDPVYRGINSEDYPYKKVNRVKELQTVMEEIRKFESKKYKPVYYDKAFGYTDIAPPPFRYFTNEEVNKVAEAITKASRENMFGLKKEE